MALVSNLGFATAFAAGAVSFLSPSVLPLVPGYVSYVAGQSVTDSTGSRARLRTIGLSLCFVLGFSNVFVLLGLGANALSMLLDAYRWEVNLASGLLVMIFGLFTAGLLPLSWLQRAALFMGGFVGRLRAFRRAGRALQLAAGAIMVVMGVAMITGHLTMFAILMLVTFPALGTIG